MQSFLFETLPGDIEQSKGILIGNSIKAANDFVCTECKHRGPLQPDPAFSKNEKQLEDFIMLKTEKELLNEELVCYKTKMPLREATLGVGISVKKSARTGLFSFVNPTMDLFNMKAFTKLGTRTALAGERFTHWLPLYFGENEKYFTESTCYD